MLRGLALWTKGLAANPALLPSVCSLKACSPRTQSSSAAKTDHDSPSPVDMEAQVSDLMDDLHSRGITQYPAERVTSLCRLLLDLGIRAETVKGQLLETPDLLGHSIKAWTSTCEVMVENGLTSLHILQSIALQPRLLQVKQSILQDSLLQFRQMKVGKQNVLSLLMKHPGLFFTDPAKVRQRLESLASMFPPTELKALVRNNSCVLTNDWEDVMAKILYIHEEMGLEQPHIAASRCLRRPLLHIKTRHQFLLRAGIYKTPNLLRDKQSHRRNPSLQDIMDTSDMRFSHRVARLTDLEYGVFKEMMAAEEVDGEDNSDLVDGDYSTDEESPREHYRKYR